MKVRLLIALILGCVTLSAQTFEERYRRFQQEAKQYHKDFRNEANNKYAEFLKTAWEYYKVGPKIEQPKEDPIPPVIYEEENNDNNDKELEGEVIEQPQPRPQPQPISPIIENDENDSTLKILFYGTDIKLRYPKGVYICLKDKDYASAWAELSKGSFENLLSDCLNARDKYQLCDWGYIEFLSAVSHAIYGNKNEATFLQAYLYTQSGYAMRLGENKNGKLFLLVGSNCILYRSYFEIDGMLFYPMDEMGEDGLYIASGKFEKEQPFSLSMSHQQRLSLNLQTIERKATSGLVAKCSVNKNLINFYNSYPTGQNNEDFCTRWANYANTPMDTKVKETLYPSLRKLIGGVPEEKAVALLLNWVQTAFTYEYDDTVWGCDRAFFAEESLYYPYCDCEDRGILFSRLVRDLLNLDAVLLYYPGHIATAVNFHQELRGDYLIIDNKKFIVCDPTYIGAPIGATMPGMDNQTAKIILLKK